MAILGNVPKMKTSTTPKPYSASQAGVGAAAGVVPPLQPPKPAGTGIGAGASAGMSASQANSGTKQSNPTGGVVPPSVYDKTKTGYFNDTYGGIDPYATKQNERYAGALASGDTNLINALSADAARVGYKLNEPKVEDRGIVPPMPNNTPTYFMPPSGNEAPQIPPSVPQMPVRDLAAIEKYVSDQQAAALLKSRSAADQAIASGKTTAQQQLGALGTQFSRSEETERQNRALEDNYNERQLSPFSGRSDYALGMQTLERGRTDREQTENLSTQQANVNADLANLVNSIDAKYAALQETQGAERQRLVQEIQADERQYELAMRGEGRADIMANADLYGQKYNQDLQSFQTNYQVDQDKIQNDANYGGVYNGNQTVQQQQQDWQNKFAYGSATGTFGNGQQTLENKQFQYGQERDKVADEQFEKEFQQRVKQDGIQNAMSWANNRISQQNANTSSSNASWARDPSNPDNIYKNAQIEGAKNSSSEKLEKEKQGLVNAFRAGKMTPAQARNQIIEDTKLGFYTEAEAKEMNDALNILTGTTDRQNNPLGQYANGGVLNQFR